MQNLAKTPNPPYYAVIFTSVRTEVNQGYDEMAEKMLALAAKQPGFLGVESARDGLGITVSYWSSMQSIKDWKSNLAHLEAQKLGRSLWYESFNVRISRVEREYSMP